MHIQNYTQQIKDGLKWLSVLALGGATGCAGLGDKVHNTISPMKRNSQVYEMQSNNVSSLPEHELNNLRQTINPSPQDYENALSEFLTNKYNLNNRQIDESDGAVNETSPTKNDFLAANRNLAPLLPQMNFAKGTDLASSPEILRHVKDNQLDDIVTPKPEDVYTGGSVSFHDIGAVVIPSSNGKFFEAHKAANKNMWSSEDLESFRSDHSVQYTIFQEGKNIGTLTILDNASDGKIVRPSINLYSNAFELGFGNYSIDDILKSGIDVPSHFSHNLDDDAQGRYLASALFAAPVALINPYVSGAVAVWNLADSTQLQDVLQYSKKTSFDESIRLGETNLASYLNPSTGNLSVMYPVKGDSGEVDALAVFNLKAAYGNTELAENGITFSQPGRDDQIMLGNIFRSAMGALAAYGIDELDKTDTKYIKDTTSPAKPTGGGGIEYQPGIIYN